MENRHLIIGDVIRYSDDSVYYNGCLGRVVKIGPHAQRIVEFKIGDDYEQVAIPAGSLEHIEVIYRAPRDNDIVREWVDWDCSDIANNEDIRGVTESGETKWNDTVNSVDSEIESIINPEYSSREEAVEDILGNNTAERLKEFREKYHIPAPDNDIMDIINAIKKRDE